MSKLFLLPSELLTQNDIDRINKMFESPKKQVKQSAEVRALACPVVSEQYYNIWVPDVNPVLINYEESLMGHRPIISSRLPPAVPMRYRSLTFGVGSTNDVRLDRFGHCNYTSPKHAVIFYDEIESRYELLNYSCYGTYVNNDLAANNEMYESAELPNKPTKEENDGEFSVDSPDNLDTKKSGIHPLKRPFFKKGTKRCFCTPSNFEGLTSGWEGSVPVPCGSVLRFGCMSFIFSLTSPNPTDEHQ